MKNDAVKNDRRIFKERIKAGEQMRKNHEKILERASEAVEQAMHIFGNRAAAVRVFPEAFDLITIAGGIILALTIGTLA